MDHLLKLDTTFDLTKALGFDCFQGDFGYGDEHEFKNKIVTARKVHECHNCSAEINKGESHRCMVEKSGGELRDFRWCGQCCIAMILDDTNGGYAFDNRTTSTREEANS